ncbi:MAG: 30S ribosome-binding factor RbfA [Gemmatimonadetes bacterium]|nr:30S ribosome-binding factor RbfA [Gemmatimonadota bacterium]
MSRRLERLGEQLRRELAGLIRTRVRDPEVGPLSVTGVDVTSDLWVARVYVHALGTPDERVRTLEGLARAAPFLRATLSRTLHIRRMPELRFAADESVEAGQRIEEILKDVLPPADSEEE